MSVPRVPIINTRSRPKHEQVCRAIPSKINLLCTAFRRFDRNYADQNVTPSKDSRLQCCLEIDDGAVPVRFRVRKTLDVFKTHVDRTSRGFRPTDLVVM